MNTTLFMALVGAYAVVIGLVVGSFLNVCIVRLPEDRSLVPRSRCPVCDTPVRARDNIPVISWILLRGRCRDCGTPISIRYPLVELLGGLLGFLAFRRFIPGPEAIDLVHLAAWGVFFTFLALLVVAAMVDLRHQIIPDQTSIYAVPVGVAGAVLLDVVGYEGWLAVGWRASVMGALMGGVVLGLAALVALVVLRREGVGWGDVKLLAMIGSFLGPWPGAFLVLLMGSLMASVAGLLHMLWTRRRTYLPLGPWLALAAAIYVFYGDLLLQGLFPGTVMASMAGR